MRNHRSVTVFGALLAAAMLMLVAVPADATKYDRKYTSAEKKEFKHWLKAQNHDWRRWMHEQKYEWWKWVHEQKHLFYKGEWTPTDYAFPGEVSPAPSDTGTPLPSGDDPPADDTPKPRFEPVPEYGNLVYRDNKTGLMWEMSPNTGKVNFYVAWLDCARRNYNGQMGMRLPTTADLTSLIDGAGDGNGLLLPQGHPFQGIFSTGVQGYWTATQGRASNGTMANPLVVYVSVSATGGNLVNTVGRVPYDNTTFAGVWCVSGAPLGPSVTD